MPSGYKWKCESCNKFFYTLTNENDILNIPSRYCPTGRLTCSSISVQPILHLDYKRHTPFIDTVASSRSRRTRRIRTYGDDYQAEARGDDDTYPDDPVPEDQDTEFVALQSHFRSSFRFTNAARADFTPKARTCGLSTVRSRTFQIAGGAVHGSPNSLMGRSAWEEMGVTDYSADRFTSAEWCHIHGASLGGPAAADNLVAASFACNSEMYAIESLLRGKTDLTAIVKVYVDLTNDRVAEYIKYIVFAGSARNKGSDFIRWIDGRGNGFNEQDSRALYRLLKAWLDRHRSALNRQQVAFV